MILALLALVFFAFDLDFGLVPVDTRAWGGLLVTLVVAVTGIVVSLPLGILLALGRRSELPAVQAFSVIFIEFWRGVPLITVLFFATYMLPLFLPGGLTINGLLRALIGVALFAAAYMAEVVRGGLQAIPKGQYEGAAALGLSYWQTMGQVVLPQALTLVIPGIVNTFIGLFKDTTLVLIVAIFDLLGQIRASFTDPNWATPTTLFTGFAFGAIVYFIFCFSMSRYSHVRRAQAFRRQASLRRTRMAENSAVVEMTGVNKWFGDFHVLRDINLKVARGERIVICGPSGSGKSTMIRCINRLEEHQSGKIVVNGVELTSELEEDRRGPPRGRHGVSAFQLVSAPDHFGEPHAGADLGAQDAEEGSRGARDALSDACEDPRAGE